MSKQDISQPRSPGQSCWAQRSCFSIIRKLILKFLCAIFRPYMFHGKSDRNDRTDYKCLRISIGISFE